MLGTTARFIFQTFPATLLGGFYIDLAGDHFVNIAHIYAYLFFVLLPYSLAVSLGARNTTAAVICTTTTAFFVYVAKYINYRLHVFFDGKSKEKEALERSNAASSSRHPSYDTTGSFPISGDVLLKGGPSRSAGPSASPAPVRQKRSMVYSYEDEDGTMQYYTIEEEVEEPAATSSDEIHVDVSSEPRIESSAPLSQDQFRSDDSSETQPISLAQSKVYSSFSLIGTQGKNLRVLWHPFPISFGRPLIEEIMDRDVNLLHMFFCVACSAATSWLGFEMMPYYHDLTKVLLCFVLASCHYSLLKKAQPESHTVSIDSSLTSFSRSFYFILLSLLVVWSEEYRKKYDLSETFSIYGQVWKSAEVLEAIRDIILNIILSLPIVFLLGLFPQLNTFLLHILEQVHIHLFGGSGISNLYGAFVAVIEDIFAFIILYYVSGDFFNMEERDIEWSYFTAYFLLLLFLSYTASTIISDPRYLVSLFQKEYEEDGSDRWLHKSRPRLIVDVLNGIALCLFWLIFCLLGYFDGASSKDQGAAVILAIVFGVAGHYILSNFRTAYPFGYLASPVLTAQDAFDSDIHRATPFARWDKLRYFVTQFEKYFIYPNLIGILLVRDLPEIMDRRDENLARALVSIASLKLVRSCFMSPNKHYIYLIGTLLLFNYDYRVHSESFLIDFFVVSIIGSKIEEAILKLRFVSVYSNPFNASWGSGAHGILYVMFLPHFSFLIFEVVLSSLLSAPLFPLAGSCAFLISYPRPLKFWEREYSTKRLNNNDMRLADNLGINVSLSGGFTINRLNAIFYQHMFVALEKVLYTDIQSGRLGQVSPGDTFIITNDKLTALVHVIEIGNGYCTFQLRGMEFKGTYCQERELEAVHEPFGTTANRIETKCGEVPELLDIDSLTKLRLFGWRHVNNQYVLRTYSVMINPAQSIFLSYDSRKSILKYYVYSVIFFATRHPSFYNWVNNPAVQRKIYEIMNVNPSEVDGIFSKRWDEDFDQAIGGVSLECFRKFYGRWIEHCVSSREEKERANELPTASPEHSHSQDTLVVFAYALSVVARRCLTPSSGIITAPEFFLETFHSTFRGDFRVNNQKDEWVFVDVQMLQQVALHAIRLSLHMHLESFIGSDDSDLDEMFEIMSDSMKDIVICPETDAEWEDSIVKERENLLTIRRAQENGKSDAPEYSALKLVLRYMRFQIVKLNREAVRGMWTGQLHELVFLQNQNSERGSIQQMKSTLRNLTNQSCDLPIGYPIYVSGIGKSFGSIQEQTILGSVRKFFDIRSNIAAN